MGLSAVDVAVLLVYLVGVVAFGCWFVGRSRTTDRFTAAGRSLPGWAVGLSIFGTYLSSNSSSTIVLSDFYKRFVDPEPDERTGMLVLRASTLVWGVLGTGVVLGVLVIAWMTLTPGMETLPSWLRNPLHANLTIVVGTLTIFLVGIVVSRLLSREDGGPAGRSEGGER